jgi:hypothetical protein
MLLITIIVLIAINSSCHHVFYTGAMEEPDSEGPD